MRVMQKANLLLLSTETCLHFDLLDFLLLSPCCFLLIGGQGDETLKVLFHLFLGLNAVFSLFCHLLWNCASCCCWPLTLSYMFRWRKSLNSKASLDWCYCTEITKGFDNECIFPPCSYSFSLQSFGQLCALRHQCLHLFISFFLDVMQRI